MIYSERKDIQKNNPTRSNPSSCCGLDLKDDKSRESISQCQLHDIINIGGNGIEVEGDAVAGFSEVDTLVGAKDGGRLDFVVASRNEKAGVHTV